MNHARRATVVASACLLLAISNADAQLDGPRTAGRSISGIYPNLAVFNSSGECGIGAVVKWQDRLWVITYAPHGPKGTNDKLYELDPELNRVTRPESIGGTPANRMIHRQSRQLIIGSYFIDRDRHVRVIDHDKLPGRTTATARHLTDPANKVYMLTMEEGLYEIDVHTLAVKELYQDANLRKPKTTDAPWLPGNHGKGGYTGQGRVLYANNGEYQSSRDPLSTKPSGCLAEWDGSKWHVVERAQFTEVTGPGGIAGNASDNDPIWATGWDHRSVILKLLDHGRWYRFRMPKGSHAYDARHGWYTEWPRIRTLDENRLLMTMHGTMYQFPKTFSARNRAGIRPLSTYLKIVSDWERFAGKLVFACDDASMMANKLCGQSQSNLWFVDPEQLDKLGPREGCGGPWIHDEVKKDTPSDPYLFAGYQRRMVHLAHDANKPVTFTFEMDAKGNGHWSDLARVEVPAQGYRSHIFTPDARGQWIRVTTDADCRATVYFHYTAKGREPTPSRSVVDDRGGNQHRSNEPGTGGSFSSAHNIFSALADVGSERSHGLVRPRGKKLGTLHFAAWRKAPGSEAKEIGYYEIGPDMKLRRVDDDQAHQWLKNKANISKQDYTIDNASVVITDKQGRRWRLPNSLAGPEPVHRGVRDVVTERRLLNCAGTIYELPYDQGGGMAKVKPVCTHQRRIHDFCSWRGLLVIAGCRLDAANDGHYVRADDGQAGLWFGTIDDLWQLGRPTGQGGPWRGTLVKAGSPSDPYLMYGYDRKSLRLRHDADEPVVMTAEIDVTGAGDWFEYKRFAVQPDVDTFHRFPEGFSARWIRLTTNTDCRATATFTYE